MSIINKSNTDENMKDLWRTPPELVEDALKLLNIDSFDVDVCCKNRDVKIERAEYYLTEEDDALTQDWFSSAWEEISENNTAFCNPPFSKKWQFFQKAVEQANRWKSNVLIVMPYTSCTREWHENVHSTNCIIYLPDGRYQYLLPDGSKPKSSCNFETCLILIVPFLCGNVIINYQRGISNSLLNNKGD